MILSDLSIKRPVFAWILMFGLIFFGGLSYQKLGISENPDVEFPTITIRYSYDGASPEVVDKDVVELVESVLVSMEGLRNMQSTSDRGSARISLEFGLDKNIDFALQEANTLLARAQRLLPDAIEPPTLTKSNAEDRPIMYLALATENLSQRELMLLFRDRVQDRLSTVDGIAEVRPFGYHEPQMRIDLDAEKLKKYQLTPADVLSSLEKQHKELPAGRLELGENEDLLRMLGEAGAVDEFSELVVNRRGGSPIYKVIRLKDVAQVYEGVENLRRISRLNGTPSLGMAIQKQRGVNSVGAADLVKTRMAEINQSLPEGTKLSINFDRTQFIRESVSELVFTLILSAILTALVCWLFIGSWSAATNILLAIPTAVIGTFIFLHFLGFTLNSFSLLGLTLAIGVIVDDAIVMLENIIRFMQKGKDRVNAAFKGSREVSFAVIATTVALVAIFMPVAFMAGIEGRFFFEFAVTICIAVSLSSLEALTLAPMRCSQFLSLQKQRLGLGGFFDKSMLRLRAAYGRGLIGALKHRGKVAAGSLLVFLASLGVLKDLSTELAPAQDRGVLFLVFQAPNGKSLTYTEAKVKDFEEIALAHPGVERIFTAVGGFGRGGQGNRGNGVVILKDRDARTQDQMQVADDLRKQVKALDGIQVFIRDRFGSAIGGRRGSPIEFTINGPEAAVRQEIFSKMKAKMDADPRIVGTRSDDVLTLPEINILPDRQKARERGVEIADIATSINIAFGGVVAGQYTQGSRRSNIYVQLKEDQRQKTTDLNEVLVRNNRGETLSLSQVVKLEKSDSPQIVFRENRERGLRVDASLSKGQSSGDVIDEINSLAEELLPSHYYLKYSSTPQDKLWEALLIMLLGLVIAYMVLASQFNSFLDPLLIFLAIPFGLTGSLLALWLGGQTLNLYSAIGILLTMGIVKKNSILLVEFTNQQRDKGKSISAALSAACDTRFRPILMTNVATIAAAIPPALALGPGAEIRVPMALTVIGGVLLSLLFTLFVVPCAYALLQPKRIRVLEEK